MPWEKQQAEGEILGDDDTCRVKRSVNLLTSMTSCCLR
jgi:hypothetical protein